MLFDVQRSWFDKRIHATSHAIVSPSKEQTWREALFDVRITSWRIGNLLGLLTANLDRTIPFSDAVDDYKIARALTELKLPPEGSLYSLKGAKYCLDTYLDELKEFDLIALRRGVLSNEKARRNILDRISTCAEDELRMQASRVLDDVAQAVNQRLAQPAVYEHLVKLVDLLAADPVDGQGLHALLQLVPDNRVLDRYFRMLTTDELKALLNALQFQGLSAARRALSQVADGSQAQSVFKLNAICIASEREFLERAPGGLAYWMNHLKFCLSTGNGSAVCAGLHSLSFAVKGAHQVCEVFPYRTSSTIRQLVEKSMDLLRDRQVNPAGPLTALSLGKLDEDTRAHLDDAEDGLRSFGLALRPHVYGTWSYEREAKRI